MSHFYGTVKGSRGEASRQGSKQSGMIVHAASWDGAIRVRLWEDDGENKFCIEQVPWHGRGVKETLMIGTLGEFAKLRFVGDTANG